MEFLAHSLELFDESIASVALLRRPGICVAGLQFLGIQKHSGDLRYFA